MPILGLIEFVAAINALMLGSALLFSSRLKRTRARNRLAGFLLCIGWMLTTFILVDQGWVQSNRLLQLIDTTAGLLVGALFLDYLLGALRRGPLKVWAYSPAIIYFIAVMVGGSSVQNSVLITHVFAVYFGYTVVATIVYLQAQKDRLKKPRQISYLLIGTWVLHIAQLSWVLWPSVGWVFDAVPLVGTAFMLGLTYLIMTDPSALKDYVQPGLAAPGSNMPSIQQLDAFMRDKKPFLDPRLSVESLAAATNLTTRQLSELINRTTNASFYDYVNRYRVQESKALLRDASEARTSIEAIGLLVGFRARSTFYESFRRITGQTPGEFRRDQPS